MKPTAPKPDRHATPGRAESGALHGVCPNPPDYAAVGTGGHSGFGGGGFIQATELNPQPCKRLKPTCSQGQSKDPRPKMARLFGLRREEATCRKS